MAGQRSTSQTHSYVSQQSLDKLERTLLYPTAHSSTHGSHLAGSQIHSYFGQHSPPFATTGTSPPEHVGIETSLHEHLSQTHSYCVQQRPSVTGLSVYPISHVGSASQVSGLQTQVAVGQQLSVFTTVSSSPSSQV